MRLLVAVGVAAITVGFVAAVDRGLAAALDLSTAVVTLIGLFGVVQGVRYANGRRNRERRTTDLGAPERRTLASVPGADLDERIARTTTGSRGGYRSRTELRRRIRTVAVAVVARDRNRSSADAERAVRTGAWTTDPTAAAFCSAERSYPLGVRLRAAATSRSRYGYGLRATVEAIERLESRGGRASDDDHGDGLRHRRRTAERPGVDR